MGLNDSISLSFMIVGHTKFSPDSCFGLFKQKFRNTPVNTLQEIADVVTQSAVCNHVEVVGWEDGVPLIPTYNWSSFFAVNMNKLTGINPLLAVLFQQNLASKKKKKSVPRGIQTRDSRL